MQKITEAHVAMRWQDFPNKQALLGSVKAALDKADGYRKRADEAVKQAKASRDADTVKNLFVALSELSATAQNVWAAVLASTSAIDAELGRLSTVRILAWNLRDIAGFERSHIAQSISAKTPIPADKLTAIAEVRAQVTLMWRLLQINIRTPEHPAIARGLQNAKEGYFAKLQPLADQMRKISSEGAPHGMTPQPCAATTPPLVIPLRATQYR